MHLKNVNQEEMHKMRINQINMPNIQGKSPQDAIKILYDHCHETAIQIMRLSNDIEDLKEEIEQIKCDHL